MRIKPGVGSVVGQTDESHWGQVLLSPHAYGIVEILDPSGNAQQNGIGMLTSLTHKLAGEILSLKDIVYIIRSAMEPWVSTVALMVPVGTVVYIVLRGKGCVVLKRGEKLSTLIDGEGAISGELQKGDTILLVSGGFTDAISNETLYGVFDHLGPQDVAEKLTLALHETDKGLGAAALVFQVADILEVEETAVHDVVPAPPSYPIYSRREKVSQLIKRFVPFRLRKLVRRIKGESRKNQIIGLFTVIVIAVFIFSVLLGIQKQIKGTNNQKVRTALDNARFAFDEGTALMELNATKGRERLTEAKAILEPLLAQTSEKSATGVELRTLYGDITNNLTQAMKIYHVTPEFFYDVTLLKKGAVINAISLSGDTLGMLDRPAGTVYAVSLTTKSGEMVASGGELAGAMNLTNNGKTLFIEAEKGIVAVNTSEKKPKVVIAKADQWKVPGFMTVFGGNLYILDTGAGRIWKYVASETGFSDTREYLDPDSFPDLSRATSLSIDGSVWVATSDSKLLKFTQGREDTFNPVGVEPPFGSLLRIITNDQSKNIYVLDSAGKRVVVLLKDGTYLAQYAWDQPLVVADFVISEEQKKILLLAEGKILSIALQ